MNQPPASTSHPALPPGAVPGQPGNPLAHRDERWQIQVRGLNKTFGPQHVLRGIDLDIERGRTNIIIGGSGQGKSVLMKHLMGLLHPDSGQIWVDGEDVVPFNAFEMGKLRRKFGMVREEVARSGWLSKLGAALMTGALKRLRRRTDYAEHGGAPLLGVDGVALICHGGSNAMAMKNAVFVADRFAQMGLRKELTTAVARHNALWDGAPPVAGAVS